MVLGLPDLKFSISVENESGHERDGDGLVALIGADLVTGGLLVPDLGLADVNTHTHAEHVPEDAPVQMLLVPALDLAGDFSILRETFTF